MAYPRLFRIFYSTVFTLFNLVLLGLLLITPADAIRQALDNNQVYNVFVIAGCYLLTLVFIILIYASRLYTNRAVLSGIPKTWIPVEKGDVGKRVRKMIVKSLSRSAVIAWNARPRPDDHGDANRQQTETQETTVRGPELKERTGRLRTLFRKHPTEEKDEKDVLMPQHQPVWADIAHEGWSPPTSPDLPNLQYVTVILELPHLIEAKAVSLAPLDPTSSTSPPMPDLRAVELLRRPAAMSLRDYMTHLTTLRILSPTMPVANFLSAYESARFSPEPRTDHLFRELMKLFADVLRGMKPLKPTLLATLGAEGDTESDIDADASSMTTSEGGDMPRSRSAASFKSATTRSGSEATIRTAPSRRRASTKNSSSAGPRSIGPGNITRSKTLPVPTTPHIKKRDSARGRGPEIVLEPTPSHHSFAQTRRPYPISQASASTDSFRSGSSGSVIRLNPKADVERGELPYSIRLGSSQSLQ